MTLCAASLATALGLAASPQVRAESLQAVYSRTLIVPPPSCKPVAAVHGVLMGKPFAAEEAYINSCSLILKQKHKIYCRLVLNFLALQRLPAGQEFFSRGKVQPGVQIYQRLKNGEKLSSRTFTEAGQSPSYALHVKFGARQKCAGRDTTSGAIELRFSDGDYVTGTFVARQSARIIWDDESVSQ
jgi:hypothetical protein